MTSPTPADHVLALVADVADLKRRVDALTAHAESLGEVASAASVTELAATVAALQEALAALSEEEENARRSWFELGPDEAAKALSKLDPWVRTVLARHGKVLAQLRPCWWQHPLVVEELLVLSQLWHKTYRGKKASPEKAADWHHRWLPGWLERVDGRREFTDCESGHAVRPLTVPDGWGPIPAEAVTGLVKDWAATRAQWPPPRRNRPVPVPDLGASA
jgi:hypothetical protein